ncbi:MAG: tRNA adenosine(34) deaminase TadA [Proteobacteria bacterium]|nr:tRNA adenosine(34) deaminase TadA [Pseudomonadota bacterium]MBU1640990.1 tRNA adenosine(34) deaminase TadA [Pseudomonadota bacterium]
MSAPNEPSLAEDEFFMALALEEARQSAQRGEVPIGAVLVAADGEILARAGNSPIALHDPTAHAEILVLRAAALKMGNYRLTDTTLYVTLEPCVMCAGALVQARLKRLVYGAEDPKAGGMVSCYKVGCDGVLNHTLEVQGGVLAAEATAVLKDFFRSRRQKA